MASLSEFFSDPASGGQWQVVPDQSTILVKAKTMWGLSSVKLRYPDFSGEGQVTSPQTVSGHLDIKAASVQTGIKKRDDHMRSADYFEVDKFPDINVVVTGADAVQGDSLDLRADLTIKGTTKPVVLKTKVTPVGDGGMRLSAQATINRQEFGVDGNMIGMMADDATISGDVVFRRNA
jgi:polyisoprenoid-binding protein YceI